MTDAKREKDGDLLLIFLLFAGFYHLPLLSIALPDSSISVIALLYWINIGGLPIALLTPSGFMTIREFGVSPQSTIEWSLIELMWLLYSYLSSQILLRFVK